MNIGARNSPTRSCRPRCSGCSPSAACPRSVLRIELTETDLLGDPEQARCVLQALRDSGVGIAVDDFGTGFASLTQLRSLPFDELKIDQLVRRRSSTPTTDAAHIVTTVVDLAHGLGLVVTAEGVETPGSLAALAEIGCDTVQGYLLGRPMPAEEAWTWLHRARPASRSAAAGGGTGRRGASGTSAARTATATGHGQGHSPSCSH